MKAAGAIVLACAALAGCGGDDGDGARGPTPPRLSDAEQAAATVRRQMQAVARGDGGAACAFFSPRALEKVEAEVDRRAGAIGCETAVEQGADGLPEGVRAALRRPAITRVDVRGDTAKVRVRLPPGLLDGDAASLPLRRNRGGWRVDGVPRL